MIRRATKEDVDAVAPLMILSMGHIAGIFAGSENYADAIPFFAGFFTTGDNQYSYENTMVFEDEQGEVVGVIAGYDGARLGALRQPILEKVRLIDPGFNPGDETEAGEYYLDNVSVSERVQGRGIGKQLIVAFCREAYVSGFDRVGLLVDHENPAALRLYRSMGFEAAGIRNFMGHRYDHLIRTSSTDATIPEAGTE